MEREEILSEDDRPLYVIYPDEAGGNWRVQAVSLESDSFTSRKALPSEWRGLRDQELSKVSSIPGCIFVHSSGFIAGRSSSCLMSHSFNSVHSRKFNERRSTENGTGSVGKLSHKHRVFVQPFESGNSKLLAYNKSIRYSSGKYICPKQSSDRFICFNPE